MCDDATPSTSSLAQRFASILSRFENSNLDRGDIATVFLSIQDLTFIHTRDEIFEALFADDEPSSIWSLTALVYGYPADLLHEILNRLHNYARQERDSAPVLARTLTVLLREDVYMRSPLDGAFDSYSLARWIIHGTTEVSQIELARYFKEFHRAVTASRPTGTDLTDSLSRMSVKDLADRLNGPGLSPHELHHLLSIDAANTVTIDVVKVLPLLFPLTGPQPIGHLARQILAATGPTTRWDTPQDVYQTPAWHDLVRYLPVSDQVDIVPAHMTMRWDRQGTVDYLAAVDSPLDITMLDTLAAAKPSLTTAEAIHVIGNT